MSVGCGGGCCERFHFGHGETMETVQEKGRLRGGEDQVIADMLIPLGVSTLDSDGEAGLPVFWFTCKHFDTTTRLCKIYEQRPSMCRTYNTKWWAPCGLKSCKMPKPERPPELKEEKVDLFISKKKALPDDDSHPSDLSVQEKA